jgi:NADPH:quinone reductase-like Zn-dependent oxidoreductase
VQLAARAGAEVVAAARGWARKQSEELGADRFLDTEQERIEDARDVDVVFDLIGGEPLARSWAALRPGGIVVSVVDEAPVPAGAPRGARGAAFVVEPRGSQLEALGGALDAGELRPIVGRVLELSAAREAFGLKGSPGVPGKLVVRPG